MSRAPGKRNARFDEVRGALVGRVRVRLLLADGASASFRALASAAEVSVATMRHYFGNRVGVFEAVFEAMRVEGEVYYRAMSAAPTMPLRESLQWLCEYLADGLDARGVAAIHAFGIAVGAHEPTVGPAYLRGVLEPTLVAVQGRLAKHASELRSCDLRVAALHFVAPLLLASLHQRALGGERVRPLPRQAFARAHVDAFLLAYGARLETATSSK